MHIKHSLSVISQIRTYAQGIKASLAQLRQSIDDDLAWQLDLLSRNLQQLEQSSNLLRVQVETKRIENRFGPHRRDR